MKKKIGISFTRTNFQNYWNWFGPQDLGDDLELVLLSFEKPDTSLIRDCDAFVLTGGVDMDPRFYDGDKVYPNQPDEYQPDRDRFEIEVYREAKSKKAPVLAICRGMQLVHTEEGGKLIQDLGERNAKHKKDTDIDKQHEVQVQPDTRLAQWTGLTAGKVNSAHHQALDPGTLSPVWTISALDDQGLIEAIEWKDTETMPFLVGVQWHPERIINKEQNPLSQAIKEQFLQSIRQIQ
ncbi:MAG TPA: gamma-glutamyl-gamma-aminobutyrate hydrolase family protein [Flavihumibacter sp.]